MAYFGQELQGAGLQSQVSRSKGGVYLRDYTHAAKVFRQTGYELAPKLKFLFHTVFDINPEVYAPDNSTDFSVLVKTVKLPSMNIQTQEYNQYNRKRIIQTKIKYDNVGLTFHDDSINRIMKLWDAYYSYYYKDGTNIRVFKGDTGSDSDSSSPGESALKQDYNSRNIYDRDLSGNINWGYIGETYANNTSQEKIPFFRNITIFGFSRHLFTAHTLINPMIIRFDSDTYNYSEGSGTMECRMDIAYESVVYNEGAIDGEKPDNIIAGFGNRQYYDTDLSPITKKGNNRPVPGPAGYQDPEGGFVRSLQDGIR